jgi:hypothetical protein
VLIILGVIRESEAGKSCQNILIDLNTRVIQAGDSYQACRPKYSPFSSNICK